MRRALVLVTMAALSAGIGAPVCEAVPVLVTSRVALGGNDFFDWGSLGPQFTSVPSGTVVNSNSGNSTASLTAPSSFTRYNQGSGWGGNFAAGDLLLYNPSLISIAFGSPVFGAGAQIQGNYYGSFTGHLTAYDSGGALIGDFSLPGVSNGNGDNSAIFIGVLDTSASIYRIEFSIVNTENPDDFAINQLDIAAVPEPGTLLLIGTGLAGLAARRRRAS